MNIGIFLNDYTPESGGASSLVKTIKNEIISDKQDTNSYIMLFKGKVNYPYKTIQDGFVYLNLTAISKLNFFQRFARKLGKYTASKVFNIVAEKENIDLFWFSAPVCEDIDYPYIFTVWDLGHRTTPYFPEVSRTGWIWESREYFYTKMLYKASYIITGNKEGKKEILTNYTMPENKIRIIPFPVASFCKGSETKLVIDLPEQYFFYPAQFWPHKNHICIIEALKILNEKGLNTTVLFTGFDKGNKKYITEKVQEYGLGSQVIFTGFVSDEEMKYLYTHSVAMIFASLMGPNNMPPIEATSLKCPVIITDLDGHKEQLGDTALYFNGFNPEELAHHMLSLLKNTELRSELIQKENELAKEFFKVNYFSEIKKIFSEFSLIRNTWGKNYNHT